MTHNPRPPANPGRFKASINAFTGTAVVVNGADTTLRDCLIMGYALAYQNGSIAEGGSTRPNIYNVRVDCTAGLEIILIGDVSRLNNIHLYPFCLEALGPDQPSSPTLNQRSGTGFSFQQKADGLICEGCFSYGYKTGFYLSDMNGVNLVACSVDNDPSLMGTNGSKGLVTANTISLELSGFRVDSCTQNYVFGHDLGAVVSGSTVISGQAGSTMVTANSAAGVDIASLTLYGSAPTCISVSDLKSDFVFGSISARSVAGTSATGPAILLSYATAADLQRLRIGSVTVSPDSDVVSSSVPSGLLAKTAIGIDQANQLLIQGAPSASGSAIAAVQVSAQGADNNIDVQLVPKGSGKVRVTDSAVLASGVVRTATSSSKTLPATCSPFSRSP